MLFWKDRKLGERVANDNTMQSFDAVIEMTDNQRPPQTPWFRIERALGYVVVAEKHGREL